MLRPALRLDDGLIHTVPRDDSLPQPQVLAAKQPQVLAGSFF